MHSKIYGPEAEMKGKSLEGLMETAAKQGNIADAIFRSIRPSHCLLPSSPQAQGPEGTACAG